MDQNQRVVAPGNLYETIIDFLSIIKVACLKELVLRLGLSYIVNFFVTHLKDGCRLQGNGQFLALEPRAIIENLQEFLSILIAF